MRLSTPLMMALALQVCIAAAGSARAEEVYDIGAGRRIPLADAISELKRSRIILIGEHHTSALHHEMQLAVLRALHDSGAKVAVGMEMFRSESDALLAAWTSRKISEDDFIPIYNDNWNYDWRLYAPILRYARDQALPVIGLNISSAITRQVARSGFSSLTEEQRGALGDVVCRVDAVYMDFIKRAYGAHAHGDLDFTHFCEAQLVWDNIMAVHALAFVAANPDHVMVIVTGTGHARKGGIPARVNARSSMAVTVILPEIPEVAEPGNVDTRDADYLFLQ